MAHSLEARVPFLDPVVDEPRARAADAAQGARASRRSGCCARRSSRCCRARSSAARKRGFSIPAAAWLRGELEPFARETLSAETLRRQGFFQPGGGDARCSTTTSPGAEDLSPPALGPARVHALARAPRRAGAGGRCASRAWRRSSNERPARVRARLPRNRAAAAARRGRARRRQDRHRGPPRRLRGRSRHPTSATGSWSRTPRASPGRSSR